MGSMIQALGEAFAGREQRIELRGGQLVVQGAAVSGTGVEVRLSGRERDVLRMLAEADGAVVSKARLLQDAWPDESADEHVVEVTVARLRRRLGAHGEAIQTVSRRGYRLRVVVGPQI
jgi:uroporphyrinogen-III synthase